MEEPGSCRSFASKKGSGLSPGFRINWSATPSHGFPQWLRCHVAPPVATIPGYSGGTAADSHRIPCPGTPAIGEPVSRRTTAVNVSSVDNTIVDHGGDVAGSETIVYVHN